MVTGTVRWFDDDRGIGLIAQDGGGEDVFCPFNAVLVDGCFKRLGPGQKVEFEVFEFPEGPVAGNVRRIFDASGALVTALCGDAVQVRTRAWGEIDLGRAAEKLSAFGEVRLSDYLVRLRAPPYEMTLFDDGRAIVKGTGDEGLARGLVVKWLGVKLPG
jgi:CspA family cold shock protein